MLRITEKPEEIIEFAGRTCYQSHDKGPNPRVIQNWIRSGHLSVIEHASATFLVEDVSLALMAQLIRHRIASFSIMSFRYTDGSDFTNITPETIAADPYLLTSFNDFMKAARGMYKVLRSKGVPKEDARMVLPQATQTKIVLTMNFRELRHLFSLRMHKSAQWEIREMATSMLDLVRPHAPIVFEDITKESCYE